MSNSWYVRFKGFCFGSMSWWQVAYRAGGRGGQWSPCGEGIVRPDTGTGHPMGAWSPRTMGRVTRTGTLHWPVVTTHSDPGAQQLNNSLITACMTARTAPLASGHNTSVTRGRGTRVAMFPHVADSSLGFSCEVLQQRVRYLRCCWILGVYRMYSDINLENRKWFESSRFYRHSNFVNLP